MTLPSNLAANPLVNPPDLPYGAPPLDRIKPEHYMPAIDWAIEKTRKNIAAITGSPDKPTFENTILASEFASGDLGRIYSIIATICDTDGDDEKQEIQAEIRKKLTEFSNEVHNNGHLTRRIKDFAAVSHKHKLDQEQRTLIRRMIDDLNPFMAGSPQASRLAEINVELSRLSQEFKTNLVAARASYKKIIDDEKKLDGVPQKLKDAFARAANNAGETGKFLIENNAAASIVLSHGKNRKLRRELSKDFNAVASSGPHDNRQIVLDIVRLRHEKAQLYGYPNYAAYVLSYRMAKTPEAVLGFLEKNLQDYTPANKEYHEQLGKFAAAKDGIKKLRVGDYGYYGRMLQEETFDIDIEGLKEYFDLENVMEGLNQHAQKLFGVKMVRADNKYPVYHPDIMAFEVQDVKTNETIGLFYADYLERPGQKRPGAWSHAIRDRHEIDGQTSIPVVFNHCNFTKPDDGSPVLLKLREVQTVFHEFGHGMHALLTKARYPSLAGTSVKWDFVELPSQLQENWLRQPEVLKTFAWRTNDDGSREYISDDLIKKINDMENFGVGAAGRGQTYLALLDMAWHTTDPATITSVEDLEDSVRDKFGYSARNGLKSTSFAHLFSGGYAAGYYSYKWAEVMDADVFEEFLRKGLYDRETAQRLQETIYAQGGIYEEDRLYRAMMGRAPDPDALRRREGLLPPLNDNQKPSEEKKQKPMKIWGGSGPGL